MYGIVSQEMINMFSSIVEFNNLIGEVVHKYRGEYKSLRLLRELFFEKIQNNPDLDKFIDYYKWIDSSLNIFLQQFVPASADVSDEIRTMVEDYVLNRSKYQHKYPQLDYKGNDRFGGDEAKLEGRVKGIRELEYNWQFGHAPITNSQTEHSTWWKERAERSNTAFDTFPRSSPDTARQDGDPHHIQLFNSASADSLNDGMEPEPLGYMKGPLTPQDASQGNTSSIQPLSLTSVVATTTQEARSRMLYIRLSTVRPERVPLHRLFG